MNTFQQKIADLYAQPILPSGPSSLQLAYRLMMEIHGGITSLAHKKEWCPKGLAVSPLLTGVRVDFPPSTVPTDRWLVCLTWGHDERLTLLCIERAHASMMLRSGPHSMVTTAFTLESDLLAFCEKHVNARTIHNLVYAGCSNVLGMVE